MNLKFFIAILTFVSMMFVTNVYANDSATKAVVMRNPEVTPKFQAGIEGVQMYIGYNLRYPYKLRKQGVKGRVVCNVEINTEGKLQNIEIVKNLHPVLDAEAVRVLKSMPHWIPGEHGGEKVITQYTISVFYPSLRSTH